jgi:hypothetical protein
MRRTFEEMLSWTRAEATRHQLGLGLGVDVLVLGFFASATGVVDSGMGLLELALAAYQPQTCAPMTKLASHQTKVFTNVVVVLQQSGVPGQG